MQSTLLAGSVAINSRLSPWYKRDRLSFDCQTVGICSCDLGDDKDSISSAKFSHRRFCSTKVAALRAISLGNFAFRERGSNSRYLQIASFATFKSERAFQSVLEIRKCLVPHVLFSFRFIFAACNVHLVYRQPSKLVTSCFVRARHRAIITPLFSNLNYKY